MRKILTLLFLLADMLCNAQTDSLVAIDEVVSAKFPGQVTRWDTIADGMQLNQYYSTVGNSTFLLQRINYNPNEYGYRDLPESKKELNAMYRKIAVDFITGIGNPDIALLDTTAIKTGKYDGYLFKAKSGKSKVIEGRMFLLDYHVYFASYLNGVDFREKQKQSYLNSLTISEGDEPHFQLKERSPGYNTGFVIGKMLGYLLILGVVAAIIILIIYLVRRAQK